MKSLNRPKSADRGQFFTSSYASPFRGRKTDFHRGKRLGKYDHLIAWSKPARPSWMPHEMYAILPDALHLRELKYVIVEPGRKQEHFVIITSLTDTTGESSV